jgi:polyphosphate kinase
MDALEARRIYMINERELDECRRPSCRTLHRQTLLPELDPILFVDGRRSPCSTTSPCTSAWISLSGRNYRFAVVEVPTDRLNRFRRGSPAQGQERAGFHIPGQCDSRLSAADVPRRHSHRLGAGLLFQVLPRRRNRTRHGIMESLIEKMASSLKQRKKADAVRFVYDAEMPQRLLDFLVSRFSLGKYDSLIPGGRYHNSKDFMSFPSVGPRYLELKPLPVIRLPRSMRRRTSLRRCPGQHPVSLLPLSPLRLRDRSAEDRRDGSAGREHPHLPVPRGRESRVVDALLNAVHNGKRVLAVVELAARFDEQANIAWASA